MSDTRWVQKSGPSPVWVDFNRGTRTVVYLDLPATQAELSERGIVLQTGLCLNVWDEDADDNGARDDLIATGVVERDNDRGTWLLRIEDLLHESEVDEYRIPDCRSGTGPANAPSSWGWASRCRSAAGMGGVVDPVLGEVGVAVDAGVGGFAVGDRESPGQDQQ